MYSACLSVYTSLHACPLVVRDGDAEQKQVIHAAASFILSQDTCKRLVTVVNVI